MKMVGSESYWHVNDVGILCCKAPVEKFIQIVTATRQQAVLLYSAHYLKFAGDPEGIKIYKRYASITIGHTCRRKCMPMFCSANHANDIGSLTSTSSCLNLSHSWDP